MSVKKDIKKVIEGTFNNQFLFLKNKFVLNQLNILQNPIHQNYEFVTNAGVYIICFENEVYKVGRHLTNARKRAFEHFGVTKGLEECVKNPKTEIYIYNVKDNTDNFWCSSLEIYLERELNPRVKSKRIG